MGSCWNILHITFSSFLFSPPIHWTPRNQSRRLGRLVRHLLSHIRNEAALVDTLWTYLSILYIYIYPWTPKTHGKMEVSNPQYMGPLTPKNEGFTWVPMVYIQYTCIHILYSYLNIYIYIDIGPCLNTGWTSGKVNLAGFFWPPTIYYTGV